MKMLNLLHKMQVIFNLTQSIMKYFMFIILH